MRLLVGIVLIHALSVLVQVAQGSINVGRFRAFNGRYLLPVAAGIGVLWAFGVANLLPERFRRHGVLLVFLALIVIEFANVHVNFLKVCYPF